MHKLYPITVDHYVRSCSNKELVFLPCIILFMQAVPPLNQENSIIIKTVEINDTIVQLKIKDTRLKQCAALHPKIVPM